MAANDLFVVRSTMANITLYHLIEKCINPFFSVMLFMNSSFPKMPQKMDIDFNFGSC